MAAKVSGSVNLTPISILFLQRVRPRPVAQTNENARGAERGFRVSGSSYTLTVGKAVAKKTISEEDLLAPRIGQRGIPLMSDHTDNLDPFRFRRPKTDKDALAHCELVRGRFVRKSFGGKNLVDDGQVPLGRELSASLNARPARSAIRFGNQSSSRKHGRKTLESPRGAIAQIEEMGVRKRPVLDVARPHFSVATASRSASR